MAKKKKKTMPIVLVVAIVAVLIFILLPDGEYKRAYKNTEKLTDYEMSYSTIITINDHSGLRRSITEQNIKVNNKNKRNMIYNVDTATTLMEADGKMSTEKSSYAYKDDFYYHALPGVCYKMPITVDLAKENLKGIEKRISIPYDKMENMQKVDGEYVFEIKNEDASDYVTSLIEAVAGEFENVSFSNTFVEVTAKVEKGLITERSFYISYESKTGESFDIEIYCNLIDTKAQIEEINEERYANIVAE